MIPFITHLLLRLCAIRKTRWIALLLLLCFSPLSKIAYASCTVVDGFHHALTLKKPAKRIISLAPNLTEILFSIGAGNQVIGVISGCDYPLAARKIRCVSSSHQINEKKIKTMHPDLIVTWKEGFAQQLVGLEKLGIPVYITNPHQLEDIPIMMKNLGCLAGKVKQAQVAANIFSNALEKSRKAQETKKLLTVFFQIGAYSLVTINKRSWINQVIAVCGGRNGFADEESDISLVDLESIVVANPEVISNDAKGQPWEERWKAWNGISAVKNKRLFTIDPDLIERAGPRVLKGNEQICKLLQAARVQKNAAIVV